MGISSSQVDPPNSTPSQVQGTSARDSSVSSEPSTHSKIVEGDKCLTTAASHLQSAYTPVVQRATKPQKRLDVESESEVRDQRHEPPRVPKGGEDDLRRSKKRKRDQKDSHTVKGQSSQEIPGSQSAMAEVRGVDSPHAARAVVSTVTKKRKKGVGRPSGLNLAPAREVQDGDDANLRSEPGSQQISREVRDAKTAMKHEGLRQRKPIKNTDACISSLAERATQHERRAKSRGALSQNSQSVAKPLASPNRKPIASDNRARNTGKQPIKDRTINDTDAIVDASQQRSQPRKRKRQPQEAPVSEAKEKSADLRRDANKPHSVSNNYAASDEESISGQRLHDTLPKDLDQDGTKERKGPFSSHEKLVIQSIFEKTIEVDDTTEAALRAAIQDWRSAVASGFKQSVEQALANRSKASLRKFCQRAFHTYNRGKWTDEEDQLLKRAWHAHREKWTNIAGIVGRRAEDCRDRWRNVIGWENTSKGPWHKDEEALLLRCVQESIDLIKKENQANTELLADDEGLQQLINWTTIGVKLGYTRTAKHCREKYQRLQLRKERKGRETSAPPRSVWSEGQQQSKSLRSAARKLSSFDIGDTYDVLNEIHTSVADHTKEFDQESTFWSVVAQQNRESRFTSALRRRVFFDTQRVYKDRADEDCTIATAAAAFARAMEEQYGVERLSNSKTYVMAEREGKPKKSANIIEDSDSEQDEDDATAVLVTSFHSEKSVHGVSQEQDEENEPANEKLTDSSRDSNTGDSLPDTLLSEQVQSDVTSSSSSSSSSSSETPDSPHIMEVPSDDSDAFPTPRLGRAGFRERVKRAGNAQPATIASIMPKRRTDDVKSKGFLRKQQRM